MLVYIFHLHDFSVIYLQGYHLTSCLQSVILLCFIFIYIFTIHKSPSQSELSQALTLPSFMICYHLTKFSWYMAMAMAVIFFPS